MKLRSVLLSLLLLLPAVTCARPKLKIHAGQYVAIALSFPHKDAPIAIGAMFDNRKSMFILDGFAPDKSGFYVGGRIPKDQAAGTYTLKEIVVDYGSHQDILTSPVDFPKYKLEIEAKSSKH